MIQQATRARGNGAPAEPARPHGLRADVRHHYESLLHRLPWPAADSARPLRTLGVTSCSSGEGVSTVAAHLALAAAGMGESQVLLADANFARPCVPRIFGGSAAGPAWRTSSTVTAPCPRSCDPRRRRISKLLTAGKPAAGDRAGLRRGRTAGAAEGAGRRFRVGGGRLAGRRPGGRRPCGWPGCWTASCWWWKRSGYTASSPGGYAGRSRAAPDPSGRIEQVADASRTG